MDDPTESLRSDRTRETTDIDRLFTELDTVLSICAPVLKGLA